MSFIDYRITLISYTMKKTIYFTLTLLALITLASSCNSNNEKKVYVKASLPNGWSANPGCSATPYFGGCGSFFVYAISTAVGVNSGGHGASQFNNDLFSQTDEFIMDLNVSKNLQISVNGSSFYTVTNPTFETETIIYVPNTVLVEVFVNGSVYDSRTVTLESNSAAPAQQNFTVIIE